MSNNGTTAAVVTDPRSLALHEVCQMWPRMSDEELAALGRDIVEHGLLNPILVHRGLILDGGNRWVAGLNAGYCFRPADFREWDGQGSLLALVCGLNDRRRHLTASQRATIAASMEPLFAAEIAQEKSRKCSEAAARGHDDASQHLGVRKNAHTLRRRATEEAARQMDVSPRYVQAAKQIRAADPVVADEIKAGRKTIPAARKELGLAPGRHRVARDGSAKPLVDVYVPEPGRVTTLEAVQEDHAERAAMRDQDSDEAWVESLPLYGQLSGKQRDDFRYAAIAARRVQPDRRRFAEALGRELKRNRKTPPYFYSFVKALEQLPPDQWHLCDERDGGCGGTGRQGFDQETFECPGCRGFGYLVR